MSENKEIMTITEMSQVEDVSLTNVVKNGIPMTTEQAEKSKAILKTALIAQARRELERVLKLTDMLDRLQDKYEEKVFDYIQSHDDDTAVQYLPVMMDTIMRCLDRSQRMLKDIAIDEKFASIMLVDASNNVANNAINVDLSTALSRSHVRDAVNDILAKINEVTDNDNK